MCVCAIAIVDLYICATVTLDFAYSCGRNMIVKSAPNGAISTRGCYTARGRRANGIVNCFIAIVDGGFSISWFHVLRTRKNFIPERVAGRKCRMAEAL